MKTILGVIGILVSHDSKYLLTKRHEPDKQFHGYWHLPGGRVEDAETPDEAIIREIKEELNLDISIICMLPETYTKFRNNNTWKGVFLCYLINMKNPNQVITLNEEASEHGWFSYEEMKGLKTLPLSEEIILKSKKLTT